MKRPRSFRHRRIRPKGGKLARALFISNNILPLVAQWIEQRSSKALMWVRFLPRGYI